MIYHFPFYTFVQICKFNAWNSGAISFWIHQISNFILSGFENIMKRPGLSWFQVLGFPISNFLIESSKGKRYWQTPPWCSEGLVELHIEKKQRIECTDVNSKVWMHVLTGGQFIRLRICSWTSTYFPKSRHTKYSQLQLMRISEIHQWKHIFKPVN